MKAFMDRVHDVEVALTATVKEFTEGDPTIGPQFTLAMALADLVKNDPGACAASRDVAIKVLDAVEASLKKAAILARGPTIPKARRTVRTARPARV